MGGEGDVKSSKSSKSSKLEHRESERSSTSSMRPSPIHADPCRSMTDGGENGTPLSSAAQRHRSVAAQHAISSIIQGISFIGVHTVDRSSALPISCLSQG